MGIANLFSKTSVSNTAVIVAVLIVLLAGVGWFAFDQYTKNRERQNREQLVNAYNQGIVDGQNQALSAIYERVLSSLQQNGFVDVTIPLDENRAFSDRLWSETFLRQQNLLRDQNQ